MSYRIRFAAPTLALAGMLTLLPALNFAATTSNGVTVAAAMQQVGALERGYRTGYSDGYQVGYRDSLEGRTRDYQSKGDYQRADRAYLPAFGAREDYRDGYQQGFAIAYGAGFDRRGFDSSVPAGLSRRGTTDAGAVVAGGSVSGRDAGAVVDDQRGGSDSDARRNGGGVSDSNSRGNVTASFPAGTVQIAPDTSMRVELLTALSTDATQPGDRFEARVVEPSEYAGAVVSGRVGRVKRAGKVRGSGELQLNFEQIRLPDGRYSNFSAQVLEVISRTNRGAGEVDSEGGVRGEDTTKDDVTKVGAGACVGAIIGAIAGGGKGAAIGAIIGGGVGAGGVLTSRNNDVRLNRGQELRIRTASETRIR